MSMTREEALEELERLLRHWDDLENDKRCFWGYDKEAVALAIAALRPITREQVEKMKASVTDVNDDDPWCDYGHCTACGDYIMVDNFCPVCGAPFTDEAVDMVMERMEVLHSETKAD